MALTKRDLSARVDDAVPGQGAAVGEAPQEGAHQPRAALETRLTGDLTIAGDPSGRHRIDSGQQTCAFLITLAGADGHWRCLQGLLTRRGAVRWERPERSWNETEHLPGVVHPSNVDVMALLRGPSESSL